MSSTKVPMPRRGVIAAAGAVGAVATVASVMRPGVETAAAQATAAASKADGAGPGYRLTDHIRRYYATARI